MDWLWIETSYIDSIESCIILNRLHILRFRLGIMLLSTFKACNYYNILLYYIGSRERSYNLDLQFLIWIFRLSWYWVA
jgi:hypothetical protein